MGGEGGTREGRGKGKGRRKGGRGEGEKGRGEEGEERGKKWRKVEREGLPPLEWRSGYASD